MTIDALPGGNRLVEKLMAKMLPPDAPASSDREKAARARMRRPPPGAHLETTHEHC